MLQVHLPYFSTTGWETAWERWMSWMGIKRERKRERVQMCSCDGLGRVNFKSLEQICFGCGGHVGCIQARRRLRLRSCESAPGLRRSRNNGWQKHQGLTSPIINPPALILLLSCSEMHLCPIRMIYVGEIYKVRQSLHSTGLCIQEEGRKPNPQIKAKPACHFNKQT